MHKNTTQRQTKNIISPLICRLICFLFCFVFSSLDPLISKMDTFEVEKAQTKINYDKQWNGL